MAAAHMIMNSGNADVVNPLDELPPGYRELVEELCATMFHEEAAALAEESDLLVQERTIRGERGLPDIDLAKDFCMRFVERQAHIDHWWPSITSMDTFHREVARTQWYIDESKKRIAEANKGAKAAQLRLDKLNGVK